MPFPLYNQCSVKSPKKTQSTDPNQWSGLLSSSTTTFLRNRTIHPLCQLAYASTEHILKTPEQLSHLVRFIEHSEDSLKLWPWCVFKIFYISWHYFTITDQKSLQMNKSCYMQSSANKAKKPLQPCKSNITHTTSRLETQTVLKWA